jgi:hypothetical protein
VKADRTGTVPVDSNRYLAGPKWHSMRLQAGAVFRQVGVSSWDCGGNLGPNPSYATRPKSLRYCMGLL